VVEGELGIGLVVIGSQSQETAVFESKVISQNSSGNVFKAY
jgi:hypothetical protein